jgi:predicted phage baseplate assembly protein
LSLASAFNSLLENADFYQPAQFAGVEVSTDSLAQIKDQRCRKITEVRQFNRTLLQRVFRDLLVSDRIEVQTSVPGAISEDEGVTWAIWDQVETFDRSGPDDRDYILDSENGVIHFGNGLNGRVPTTSEVIRARFYRYSQLEKGNVPALRFWSLAVQLPPGASFTKQQNLTPASGGRRPETIEEAKGRSRAVFRTETPILTIADYEELVRITPGLRIARVKVLPNFNPEFGCMKMPGDVTIVVEAQPAPKKSFPDVAPVEASDGFLATVRNHLEPRRIVTTNLHVVGPKYHEIRISSLVFLKKRSSEAEVKPKVESALLDFFDAASGGPDKLGWDFGRSVFTSEVSQQIAQVLGVDYVTSISVNNRKPGCPEPLGYNELPKYVPGNIRYIPFEQRGTLSVESNGPLNVEDQKCKGKNCG